MYIFLYTRVNILTLLLSTAEFSVPHTNIKETTFHGYTIPADSLIHANLLTSNMDPKHWDNPTLFDPERHMKDGKIQKNPAFMPFSVGMFI